MDPNANLIHQLHLAKHIVRGDVEVDALELAELVIALNDWIVGGGFLPDRWEVAQKRAKE